MSYYCSICHCATTAKDNGANLIRECPRCANKSIVTGADTMLFSRSSGGTTIDLFDKLIRFSADDPTTLKMESPCNACKRPIRSLLLLGEQKKPIYVCKCGEIEAISTS